MDITAELVRCNVDSLTHRFFFPVQVYDEYLKINRTVNVLLDTGASSVLISAKTLGLSESQRTQVSQYFQLRQHHGVVSNIPTESYRYLVSSFSVGDKIILKDFPICISFDPRVKVNLLGMPFLKLFTTHIVPSKRAVVLQATSETDAIVTGSHTSRDVDMKGLDSLYTESPTECSLQDFSRGTHDENTGVRPMKLL